ncbi:MAG: DDE-type integrase/transposase/recombinase [Planctomycetota bacterium]
MIKQVFIILLYLLDYATGRAFYIISHLIGKNNRLISSITKRIYPLSELHYLREEVRRLKFANSVMRTELNRVTQKKPCLCKKLQIIYFKLRFDISLRKISRYLPISKTALMNYLNQLQSGISNLASRIRQYHNAPTRTPVSIAMLIWEIHKDNPHWGRWKIALAIWKIGVYVSPSTVRNILNTPKPDYHTPKKKEERIKMRAINGKYPNHIWSIDLTTVYVFFRPLYILAILDHYSRKVMTLATTFNPTSNWVIRNIGQIIEHYGKPKHLISDYGTQFTANDFREYVERQNIYHRYARISKANGNSKVERYFRSLKYELLNLYLFFSKAKVDKLLKDYLTYYNEYRPHETLDGRVPNDRYCHRPRDKPDKNDKVIKGTIERIEFADGLLKAYRLRKSA